MSGWKFCTRSWRERQLDDSREARGRLAYRGSSSATSGAGTWWPRPEVALLYPPSLLSLRLFQLFYKWEWLARIPTLDILYTRYIMSFPTIQMSFSFLPCDIREDATWILIFEPLPRNPECKFFFPFNLYSHCPFTKIYSKENYSHLLIRSKRMLRTIPSKIVFKKNTFSFFMEFLIPVRKSNDRF